MGEEDDESNDASLEEIVENVPDVSQRPQMTRMAPTKPQDFEVNVDNEVIEDGYFVHFAILADAEPINHNETYNAEMIEELAIIERNNTWKLANFQLIPK